MNTHTLIINKKNMNNNGSKSMFIKRWERVNSSGSNGNSNPYSSAIVYNTSQVGEKIPFSIGDNWIERIGKMIHSYKVAALEDIIIPAGVYKCYRVIEELENGAKNYYWFAPDVGLVKWEIGEIKGILQGCVKDNEV